MGMMNCTCAGGGAWGCPCCRGRANCPDCQPARRDQIYFYGKDGIHAVVTDLADPGPTFTTKAHPAMRPHEEKRIPLESMPHPTANGVIVDIEETDG